MKKRHLVYAIGLIVGMGACAASAKRGRIQNRTYGKATM